MIYFLVSNISNGPYTNMPLTELAVRSAKVEGQRSTFTGRLKVLERSHLLTQSRDLALQQACNTKGLAS